MTVLLEVKGLEVSYGHIAAVKGIDFALNAGEITSLVGANGAGKSTTLLALSGLIPKAQGTVRGSILFEGEDVAQWSPHKRVARGIVQVAEGRAILTTMTVRENLELGAYTRQGRHQRSQAASDLERVFHLFPRLKERIDGIAGNLSGGEQQMLAIGRALMSNPRLLLLDEPSMGLAPKLIKQIFDIVTEINSQGTTVLLVEQNAAQALKRSHRAYILETGEIVREGTGKELAADPAVKAAYLGGDV